MNFDQVFVFEVIRGNKRTFEIQRPPKVEPIKKPKVENEQKILIEPIFLPLPDLALDCWLLNLGDEFEPIEKPKMENEQKILNEPIFLPPSDSVFDCWLLNLGDEY